MNPFSSKNSIPQQHIWRQSLLGFARQ